MTDHRDNHLSDVLGAALAGHATFEAGMRAADENSPSARKLAALIADCETALAHLNEYGCNPAFQGNPYDSHAAILLRNALLEARR